MGTEQSSLRSPHKKGRQLHFTAEERRLRKLEPPRKLRTVVKTGWLKKGNQA